MSIVSKKKRSAIRAFILAAADYNNCSFKEAKVKFLPDDGTYPTEAAMTIMFPMTEKMKQEIE
jgi:hypothetical protein